MQKKFVYIVRANCDEAKANIVVADYDTLRGARRCKRLNEKRRLAGGTYWNIRIIRVSRKTYRRWTLSWGRVERVERVFAPRALTMYEPRVRVEPTPLEAYVF